MPPLLPAMRLKFNKWNNSNALQSGKQHKIDQLLEEAIQSVLVLIFTNNKPSQNRKPGAVICRLIPKIIVFSCIVITISSDHQRSSEAAATTSMVLLLVGDLFLRSRSQWLCLACQVLIGVTVLLFCIRSIPPDSRSLFQMDYISGWDSNLYCPSGLSRT